MIYIDTFGKSFVIDRKSNAILLSETHNEIAKHVSGIMLDTYVLQLHENVTEDTINILSDSSSEFARFNTEFKIIKFDPLFPEEVKTKKNRARMLRIAISLLLEQAVIAGSACDNISSLSSFDFFMYSIYKEKYIEQYAESMNIDAEQAQLHLDFLHNSMLSFHFRKSTLIWKNLEKLKNVFSKEEYIVWKTNLLDDTVKLGRV